MKFRRTGRLVSLAAVGVLALVALAACDPAPAPPPATTPVAATNLDVGLTTLSQYAGHECENSVGPISMCVVDVSAVHSDQGSATGYRDSVVILPYGITPHVDWAFWNMLPADPAPGATVSVQGYVVATGHQCAWVRTGDAVNAVLSTPWCFTLTRSGTTGTITKD